MLNLQLVLLRSTIQSRTRQVAKLFHNLVKYGYGWYNYTKWAFTFKIRINPKHIRESSIYSPCINELSIVNGFIYNPSKLNLLDLSSISSPFKAIGTRIRPLRSQAMVLQRDAEIDRLKKALAEQRQLTEEVCQAGFCRENVGDFGEPNGKI